MTNPRPRLESAADVEAAIERMRLVSGREVPCEEALRSHVHRKSKATLRDARSMLDTIQPPRAFAQSIDPAKDERVIRKGVRRLVEK